MIGDRAIDSGIHGTVSLLCRGHLLSRSVVTHFTKYTDAFTMLQFHPGTTDADIRFPHFILLATNGATCRDQSYY